MHPTQRSPLDRFLGLFSEVRAGEGRRAVVMLVNVFLLLTAYYVIKTVREPMILADGSAELKSWASAGQAVALIAFVPVYGWVSSRLPRRLLIVAVSGFFVVCLQLFYPAAVDATRVADALESSGDAAEVVVERAVGVSEAVDPTGPEDDDVAEPPMEAEEVDRKVRAADFLKLGFIFYVWVGIFSLALIAQFWSFANDIYTRAEGERLFPIIAIGAAGGAAFGSKATSLLFSAGVGIPAMLQVATALLVLHAAMMWGTSRRVGREHVRLDGTNDDVAVPRGSGFAMILRSPYLRLLALVILLLNLVNTNGEYILSRMVVDTAHELHAAGAIDAIGPYIGRFYGDFFSVVTVATMVVQAFLVGRIVRHTGMSGVLFLLPLVALGAYALLAAGVGLGVYRWAKTAENTSDYSVMNTAKALVWLPTTREEKYKAKQAVDTLVVRFGDLAATGIMVLGTQVFTWTTRGFAGANLVMVAVWLGATWGLLRRHRQLVSTADAAADTPS